jgi:hypothetical protein
LATFWLQIRDIRLQGGDCIVSFGGASGQEQAQVRVNETMLVSSPSMTISSVLRATLLPGVASNGC